MSLRPSILVAVAVAAALLFVALIGRFWFVCDDAYIAFTYSKNLAAGHGLVWFPGAAPVEGFSDPLWVLLMALVRLSTLEPVVVAPWISAICGVLLVGQVALLLLRRVGLVAATAATVLLATLPAMSLWSTSGLETMPAALATFWVFAALLGDPARPRPRAAAVAAAVLALLRPEGLPLVGLWLVLGGLRWRTRRSEPLSNALFAVAAVAIAASVAWLLFRLGYFGDWLPNTARAKGGFHWFRVWRGLDYVIAFLLTAPGLLIAAGLSRLAWTDRDSRDLVAAAGGLIAAIVAYAVAVGGDFMPMGRFLVPAMPFVALVFGVAAQRLAERERRLPLVAALVGTAALDVTPSFDVFAVPAPVRQAFHFRGPLPVSDDEMMIWRQLRDGAHRDEYLASELAQHTRPGQKLIHAAIGVLGYRTELQILDSFALVERRPPEDHVLVPGGAPGHDRYLPWEVLLDERPDYIHAHLDRPGAPIVYGLLAQAFELSPLADMVEVERFPVAPESVFEDRSELRVLRFKRWDPAADAMRPLVEAAAATHPGDGQALQVLDAALPAGARRDAQDASLRRLLGEGRIANISAGPLSYSHAALPSPRSLGFSIDVTLQSGPMPPVSLPRGKFVYALPIAGDPEIDGVKSGWVRVPPSPHRVDVVHGGKMLLVHLIPGGKTAFTR